MLFSCQSCCDVRTQVHASLIVVLTRGGSTARLVAKYRPSIPVLTVAVPVLTTDSLTWSCSGAHVTHKHHPMLTAGVVSACVNRRMPIHERAAVSRALHGC